MKTTILACLVALAIATSAVAGISCGSGGSSSMGTRRGGTLMRRPAAMTPTWDYSDRSGYRYEMRRRPGLGAPTYDWRDNRGRSGTMRQRPGQPGVWDFD